MDLYEPIGSGLISKSKSDFEIENQEDYLIVKAPKSKVPQLIITAVLTLAFMVFIIHRFMPDFQLFFYIGVLPASILVVGIAYAIVGSYHKKGDWFVWDKKTDRIDFPRLSKSDSVENFLCFQMIHVDDDEWTHTEVNCVFKAGAFFQRYPLFLSSCFELDTYVFNLAHQFGVPVQKVRYKGKKPIVSGYDFIEALSSGDVSGRLS